MKRLRHISHRVVPRRIRHKSARFQLRIGKSRIHGLGVFALEDIPAGRELIEYTGKRLSSWQVQQFKPPRAEYVLSAANQELSCYIDGRVRGSGAEFINHSCDPNVLCRQKGRRVVAFSRRRIQAGEELTMYFGFPIKARRVPCLCGAQKCRKTLRYIMDWSRPAHESKRLDPRANFHAEVVEIKSRRLTLRRISPKFTRFALGVGRSGIDNTGVYALKDIPARCRVIEYTGRRLSRVEDAHLKFPNDIYVAGTLRGSIDGAVGGNGAQFINHSCDPNLTAVRTRNSMFFRSRREIRAGEELSWRYAYPFKLRRIPCRCGARNCRKTLRLIVS
jgi:uncharacterized protein